jgi:hypothetical protein
MKQIQLSPYMLTRSDPLIVIMEQSPRAVELLAEYDLYCLKCFANDTDTLEMTAEKHKMTVEDMQEMIDEINAQLEKEWQEQQKISKS